MLINLRNCDKIVIEIITAAIKLMQNKRFDLIFFFSLKVYLPHVNDKFDNFIAESTEHDIKCHLEFFFLLLFSMSTFEQTDRMYLYACHCDLQQTHTN